MRFESKLPDDSVNIGEGSPVREAGLLIVGVIVTALVITTVLALSIEAIVPLVPPSLEVRVFNRAAELAGAFDEGEDEARAGEASEEEPEGAMSSDPRTAQVQSVLERLAGYLSTHPLGPDRILAMDAFIQASGWATDGEQPPWKAMQP